MEIRERIILDVHHYGPAGSQIKRPSINDEPYETLLKNLQSENVLINPKLSEKIVKYFIGNLEMESTVPIETTIPVYIRKDLQSYTLRDGNLLELFLKNWENITSRPPRGVIGGTVSGRYGIIGNLTIATENFDEAIIGNIRRALKETYMKKFDQKVFF